MQKRIGPSPLIALLLQLQLLLALLTQCPASAETRVTCSSFTSCGACASHTSWLGTPCRWCPIDLGCHEPGSLVNKCSSQQEIQDPSRCRDSEVDKGDFKFNPRLSELAVALSGAAYSPDPVPCLANFPQATQAAGFLTDVTKATVPCDVLHDDCSGFVGRLSQVKRIALVFRGTKGESQLMVEGLMGLAMPKEQFQLGGKVQAYFSKGFNTLWPHLREPLLDLMKKYPDHSLLVTGHSLGGAIAALAAASLAALDSVPASRMAFYSFGEPRVGDYSFAVAFDRLVPNSWRVVHGNDVVAHLPICSPVLLAAKRAGAVPFSCSGHLGFPYHHGTEVFYPRTGIMEPGSPDYRVCTGTPVNEDSTCANSSDNWTSCLSPSKLMGCVKAHKTYYGIHLGGWWDENQCTGLTENKSES